MKIIGDPHIGREFRAFVPLDRRGEREQNMMNDFANQLITPEKLIVIIGDLFDSPNVAMKYIMFIVRTLLEAAEDHRDKQYIVIAGNHDITRSDAAVGAFDVLQLVAEHIPNLHVLRRPTTLCGVVFFPWEWDRTALEQVDDIKLWTDTAIGHWDLVDYGGSIDHLCPATALRQKGVTRIISGHWHLSGIYDVGGVEVECTGSMQPMTHAEDKEGKLYVTYTREEYDRIDLSTLKDKYVRVLVAKGDELTPPPTCLGFRVKDVDESPQEVERVTLGDFDIKKILDDTLMEHEVPKDVQAHIKGRLSDIT